MFSSTANILHFAAREWTSRKLPRFYTRDRAHIRHSIPLKSITPEIFLQTRLINRISQYKPLYQNSELKCYRQNTDNVSILISQNNFLIEIQENQDKLYLLFDNNFIYIIIFHSGIYILMTLLVHSEQRSFGR